MNELPIESLLLRVYCLASDNTGDNSLHTTIIECAHRNGLSGATAMIGIMGYGRGGFIYNELLSEYGIDQQPIVVEIVDEPSRIQSWLPTLHSLVRNRRLITVERAEVIYYRAGNNVDA